MTVSGSFEAISARSIFYMDTVVQEMLGYLGGVVADLTPFVLSMANGLQYPAFLHCIDGILIVPSLLRPPNTTILPFNKQLRARKVGPV